VLLIGIAVVALVLIAAAVGVSRLVTKVFWSRKK